MVVDLDAEQGPSLAVQKHAKETTDFLDGHLLIEALYLFRPRCSHQASPGAVRNQLLCASSHAYSSLQAQEQLQSWPKNHNADLSATKGGQR